MKRQTKKALRERKKLKIKREKKVIQRKNKIKELLRLPAFTEGFPPCQVIQIKFVEPNIEEEAAIADLTEMKIDRILFRKFRKF